MSKLINYEETADQ